MELSRQYAVTGEVFGCTHITEQDKNSIAEFHVKDLKRGYGLERYLKECALEDEQNDLARTYLVWDLSSNELAGYFTLKAGFASAVKSFFSREFDSIPGIELANFAVNATYVKAHPDFTGVGMLFFYDLVLPIVSSVAQKVGVKLLYIFALPYESLINRYKQYGFDRLVRWQERRLHRRIKPKYDRGCVFMYMPIKNDQ